MSPRVPSSKAAGFVTVVNVLRERSDARAFAQYLAALPAETASLVETPPIAIAWLPIDHFYAVTETAQRILFRGDEDGVVDVGHRSIGRDLGTLYRLFVGLASPAFVMARTAQLWGAYNQDHGKVTVALLGPNAADITYSGIPRRAPAAFWAFQRGALRAVVEATGLGGVTARMLASAEGSPSRTIRVAGAQR